MSNCEQYFDSQQSNKDAMSHMPDQLEFVGIVAGHAVDQHVIDVLDFVLFDLADPTSAC
jgi:hypothetical protein